MVTCQDPFPQILICLFVLKYQTGYAVQCSPMLTILVVFLDGVCRVFLINGTQLYAKERAEELGTPSGLTL